MGESINISNAKSPSSHAEIVDLEVDEAIGPSSTYSSINSTAARPSSDMNQKSVQFFKDQLEQIIRDQDFEYGFTSEADRYFDSIHAENTSLAITVMNSLYLERLGDRQIMLGILQMLAHQDFQAVYPFGQTMAIAALAIRDIEIKEAGIRAFERWNSPDSIPWLKAVDCDKGWLSDYLSAVIHNISRGD